MGKYTNVNVNSLLRAVNTALSELSKYSLGSISVELNSKNVLESSVKDNVSNAFYQVINSRSINGSIAVLKNRLDNLKKAANYIDKCQDLEKEIERLRDRLYDSEGSKRTSIQRQINSKKSTLSSYENRVDSLLS